GGAWGIAVLAAYMANRSENESLEDYLNNRVFKDNEKVTVSPDPDDVAGFDRFMERYVKGLAIERSAVENLE
ncbi:MAG TPA: ATPase, partial [Clostridiaceae bacterium]|nr:ATPase [Clostridiaceae bacterium]